MTLPNYQTTLERLCRDELALAGAQFSEIEITAIVVADVVARSSTLSITDAIERTRLTNPSWFRTRPVSR